MLLRLQLTKGKIFYFILPTKRIHERCQENSVTSTNAVGRPLPLGTSYFIGSLNHR